MRGLAALAGALAVVAVGWAVCMVQLAGAVGPAAAVILVF